MTTIAFRNGVMAADKRVVNDGWITSENGRKLHQFGDGAVAGFSGSPFWAERWLAWYVSEEDRGAPLDLKDECQVLLAQPGGRLWMYVGTGRWDLSHEPFRAIGSGWPIARAALLTGASPLEAVELASRIDPSTGGTIDLMEVRGWAPPTA